MQVERYRPRRRDTARGLAKFFLLNLLIAALAVGGVVGFFVVNNASALDDFGPPAADLNPVERYGLAAYLSLHRDALATPAGLEAAPVVFVVEPGETAGTVASRLAQMGLVADADLLRYYMRYKGLDDQIEAGNFSLSPAMTIPTIASALTDAAPDETRVRLWEGWRLEQFADALAQQPNLSFSTDEFLRLVGPGGRGIGEHSFLQTIPEGVSLEGFLFPDTYRFSYQATTTEVVNRILARFEAQVTPTMRADAAARGFSLYEVIVVASIVEREGVHDDERPAIASVFLNRLAIGMKLDADPTTQYAVATADNWWPPLTVDPRTVDHPYNTYLHTGLPPGPIANPGLASIRAVIYPAQTAYYYFRARCDGSKYHNFAVTYQEHLNNGCP